MPHLQALTRLRTAFPSKQELQCSWLQTQTALEDPRGQGEGQLTGWVKEQQFFPSPHKANRNYVEVARGEISSMFFQDKWEKSQRVHCVESWKEKCQTALAQASSAARQQYQHSSG